MSVDSAVEAAILSSDADGIRRITLNRPQAANALRGADRDRLIELLEEADGDHGLAAVEHGRDQPLRAVHDPAHAVGGALGVSRARAGDAGDVRARAEMPAVRVDDDHPDRGVLVRLVDQLDDAVAVLRAQRVGRLRAVQRDPADAVGVAGQDGGLGR